VVSTASVPRPRGSTARHALTQQQQAKQQHSAKQQPQPRKVPSYEERCRAAFEASKQPRTKDQPQRRPKLFVPRSLQDFQDGGAFPEIHVAQYPRHMGNPHKEQSQSQQSQAIVNVEIDKDGEVSYDAIVKGGTNSDKIVYTTLQDVRGGDPKDEDVVLPTDQEVESTTAKTQAALQSLLQTKIAMDRPTGSAIVQAETSQERESKTQFVKYKARETAPGYNPAAATRVIQILPAQLDPMMPPKHKHEKAPRGPAEDFVPVLQAPNEKLSKEERAAWNIPACISNWKNTRGYTIPLDKRLAADGRHLQETPTINSNFATLSESLYVAERQARQEVRLRAQVQQKLALNTQEQREQELRQLANQVRLERQHQKQQPPKEDDDDVSSSPPTTKKPATLVETLGGIDSSSSSSEDEKDEDDTDEQVAERQRERLRMERKRERERELRMEHQKSHQPDSTSSKKQKLEAERDVSEKIALGQLTGTTTTLGGDVDSRLINQSAGMNSGFGADDEYNTYTKPLFGGSGGAAASSSSIYRPTRGDTEQNADEQYKDYQQGHTSKFQPDQGFSGADGGGSSSGSRGQPRNAPVQFEKQTD